MAERSLEEDMEPLSGGDSGDSGDELTGDSDSDAIESSAQPVEDLPPVVTPLDGARSVWDEEELADLRTAESSPTRLGDPDDVAAKMLKMSVNSDPRSPAQGSLPKVVYQTVPVNTSPSSNDSDCTIQGESPLISNVEVEAGNSNDQATGISAEALDIAIHYPHRRYR